MKRVLALIEAGDHVCYRYRLQAFEPALRKAGWELVPQAVARGPGARTAQLWAAGDYEAVVLQRKLLPGWQFSLLRKRAKRLIFDFDDAVLYRDSHDARGPYCRRRAQRFARVVRASDVVVAGNTFLAYCAVRQHVRPERVVVIPTCVEPGRYGVREFSAPGSGGPLELVWLGSSSTFKGMEQSVAIWDGLGREVAGVRLKVISDRFGALGAMPIVEKKWRLVSEFEDLAGSDVGVSWVPDDLWSRGKCGLKVLQYQAAGLPVVTNPVGVHPELVRSGENGFLATTPREWLTAVRALGEDAGLRARMGAAARHSVERSYSVAVWSRAFVAAVTGEGEVKWKVSGGMSRSATG